MMVTRRRFIYGAVSVGAAGALVAGAEVPPRYKAVVFDGFPIFDPRPVFHLAETLFPGKGAELSAAWRTRQFEYQWLRALSGQYADFTRTTDESLTYASKTLHLELTAEKRSRLLQAYHELPVWPDAQAALRTLQASGLRLGFLSNMTERMLENGVRKAGLNGTFEQILSTDRLKTYKPDPRAYQLGVDAFKLRREEILFAAFAGWDVAGARWFGYPTFWVNRLELPGEELGMVPTGEGQDLAALVRFVKMDRAGSFRGKDEVGAARSVTGGARGGGIPPVPPRPGA